MILLCPNSKEPIYRQQCPFLRELCSGLLRSVIETRIGCFNPITCCFPTPVNVYSMFTLNTKYFSLMILNWIGGFSEVQKEYQNTHFGKSSIFLLFR